MPLALKDRIDETETKTIAKGPDGQITPITTYEDVKDQSTESYFKNNKFSVDAFEKKYALHPEETYIKALKRVCDFVASVEENDELKEYWSVRWFDEIYNDWWHPAGSIMQGANSGKAISMANCTTCSLGTGADEEEWDNLESIVKNLAYTVAKSAAYRQGLGFDCSRLRPAGTQIMNSANESTGAIHWMKFIDSIGYYVGQNGRIPAFLVSLRCDHPDVEEFIQVKSDFTKIQNANISVQCTNKFYEAAKKNEDWELKFEIPEVKQGDKIYVDVHSIDMECQQDEKGWYKLAKRDRKGETISKTVKARKLMELIAKNMFNNAEPGIQNIDIAKKYSNSDYVYDPKHPYSSKIVSTNACCLVAETKVLTDRGYISMDDIFIKIKNNEVLSAVSYNIKSGRYEMRSIINAWQQRNDSTVTLEIEDEGTVYSVECSSDHPILTNNRGYVEAASLTENDDIVLFK